MRNADRISLLVSPFDQSFQLLAHESRRLNVIDEDVGYSGYYLSDMKGSDDKTAAGGIFHRRRAPHYVNYEEGIEWGKYEGAEATFNDE